MCFVEIDCTDTDNGATDSSGMPCTDYVAYVEGGAAFICGEYDDDDFFANTMCCACKNAGKSFQYLVFNDCFVYLLLMCR